VKLKPDLVLLARSSRVTQRLESMGIRVVANWDGAGMGSAQIQAGVYYYRLSINDGTTTRFLTSKLVKF